MGRHKDKQKLMNGDAYKKKLNRKNQASQIDQQQNKIQQKMALLAQQAAEQAMAEQAQADKEKKAIRAQKLKVRLWISLVVLTIIFLALPKPKLIEYRQSNLAAQSIYIPSYFGTQHFLLDTDAEIRFQTDQDWLYTCHTIQQQQNCQRFEITEIKGLFSVLHYILAP